MQFFSPVIMAETQGWNNSKSTTLTKPVAGKEQAMDFMQLLLMMTRNQEATQQDTGTNSLHNYSTGNAGEKGNDAVLENNTFESYDVTSDINTEIMQLLQSITCNPDIAHRITGITGWDNFNTGNASGQDNDIALGNNTFKGYSAAPGINPEAMQLLQLITYNPGAIQQAPGSPSWNISNIENADQQGNNVILENIASTGQSVMSDISPETMQMLQMVGNQLNLLLKMAAVTGEYKSFCNMDNLPETLSQQGVTLTDVLSLAPGYNLNLNLKQIINANALLPKNMENGLTNDTTIEMDLDGYFIGRPEADGKMPLSRISNTTSGTDLNGSIKTQPLATTLPQQVNLDGPAKNSSIATANNNVQFALKIQPENVGANLPQQEAVAGLLQAVDNKVDNTKFSAAKADSTTFGVIAQKSNVNVASVNVTADSGAKHESQQFTRQDSGSQTAAAGLETFTVKSSNDGILQQLRVNDKSFVTKFAEIIKGHVSEDSSGQTHIKLQLQPESLGQVIIKLVFKDGNISTQFQAATEHAKQIIENSLPQLRETLANFQLNLQNASVTVGGENGGSGKWGREWNQGGSNNSRRNQLKGNNDDVEVVDGLSKPKDAVKQNQINYFI
ncbi:hook-length control protein FliK [Desulfotomaculum arcticum]|uniref:Hook-length control protein FliK n=1 Tax=Desulfotruncus arcticus DSM 17038 TaxID=1121424 RepID=A0A1I2MWV7_9FIRM|nr:flagellar hook-length control protein FliK [Desulfotruncus arcticus]SFF95923.1 hook-length control protein FliK [Desulfotomaculum arcticum] [Desulfotruncus arcticus DSM 17038]